MSLTPRLLFPGAFLRIIGSSPFTPKWLARHLGVIREMCSQALNILDRFHIVAKVNEALDDIRAAEARRIKADGYEPLLAKSR